MGRKIIGYNVVSFVVLGIVLGATAIIALLAARRPDLGNAEYVVLLVGIPAAVVLSLAPRVADQWERGVVLRLGRFIGLKGPGLFWVIPLIDRVTFWIDLRVRTTGFAAEKTLTQDTVPVNVDAVLFWSVIDAEKAALAVERYEEAVAWAAQTALRDIIGKTMLADMLVGREALDIELQKLIDARTHDWGISVHSVEIRDVVIPAGLEDAMSRKAQAEREKQARVILGDAEVEISEKFSQASQHYKENPMAFQLRAMNMLYEGMKERGSMMVIPSSLTQSLDAGSFAGLAALGSQLTAGAGEPRGGDKQS
jgi:regulator of protease activity HflC (stomatin/prohibitin superfamily)